MDNVGFVLDILERVLGKGVHTSGDNYIFSCPSCSHRKKKLEVNLTTEQWNCWVCGNSLNFKGKTLKSLLTRVKAPVSIIDELKYLSKNTADYAPKNDNTVLTLPPEYKTLLDLKKTDIVGRHVKAYLKKRHILEEEIVKYNIGYCESGSYSNHVIIPSYDEAGSLNYFVARNIDDTAFQKYKNPPVDKNIIGFEMYINWDVPVILCEGLFDAIAIKRNVIPLLGKTISDELMKKLITSKVQKVYIALDKDALKDAIKHCETLMNAGKKVYFVELDDKDPSDMGFEHFTKIIQKTEPLTLSKLIKLKFNM